jgi:hypothetical protein
MKLQSKPMDCFSCALHHHHFKGPTSIHYVTASRG